LLDCWRTSRSGRGIGLLKRLPGVLLIVAGLIGIMPSLGAAENPGSDYAFGVAFIVLGISFLISRRRKSR